MNGWLKGLVSKKDRWKNGQKEERREGGRAEGRKEGRKAGSLTLRKAKQELELTEISQDSRDPI